MTKSERTRRFQHLHDQLLRKFESEQSALQQRVQEERLRLDQLSQLQGEVELGIQEGLKLGWEALSWSAYRERVDHQWTRQSQVLSQWQERLDTAKARTLSAFQDAKRWERLAKVARELQAQEQAKVVQRGADELATTRRMQSGAGRGVDAT